MMGGYDGLQSPKHPAPPVSGKARHTYPDGGVYEGEFEASLRHGSGMMVFPDGTQYRGAWKMDKQHGAGEELTPDKTTYRGSFEMGQRHGKGVEITVYGDEYNGDWVKGVRTGEGDYFSDGLHYEGEWKGNLREGQGKCVFRNGDLYEGEFVGSLMEGEGQMMMLSGCQYTGGWRKGKMHGMGVMVFPNGDVYEGEWLKGRRHGNGLHKSVNGATYIGSWENGLRHGHGVLTNVIAKSSSYNTNHIPFRVVEGDTYDGEWQRGLRHGIGTVHRDGRVLYQGEFLNDKRDGHGDGIAKDGSRYIGAWREGRMHGRGKCYPIDGGEEFEGDWEGGVLKRVLGRGGGPSEFLQSFDKGRERILQGRPDPAFEAFGDGIEEGELDGPGGFSDGDPGHELHDIDEGDEAHAAQNRSALSDPPGSHDALPPLPSTAKSSNPPLTPPPGVEGVMVGRGGGGGGEDELKREEMLQMSARHGVTMKGSFDEQGRYLPPVSYQTMRDWHALKYVYSKQKEEERSDKRSGRAGGSLVFDPPRKEPGYRDGGRTAKEHLSYRPIPTKEMAAGPGEFSFKRWRVERGYAD